MNWDHDARHEAITGQSGYGKSTLAVKLIKEWKYKYLFVFDRNRQFARKNGLRSCINSNQMLWCLKHRYPIVFDPQQMFPSDPEPGFDFFLQWVYAVSKTLQGVKLIYCDEIQFAIPYTVRDAPHSLREVCDDGRKEEIDWLFVVNGGYQYLHHEIRKQVNKLCVFHTEEGNAIKKLRGDGVPEEKLKQLRSLKKGQFITKP